MNYLNSSYIPFKAQYMFWIGDLVIPITPESLEHNYRSTTKTTASIENGELVLTNKKGLLEYSFTIMLPQSTLGYDIGFENLRNLTSKIPGIGYELDRITHTAKVYLNTLEYYKNTQEPFTFSVVRSPQQQRNLFETCKVCIIDSMKIHEDAKKRDILFIDIGIIEYNSLNVQTYSVTDTEIKILKSQRTQTTWYDMENTSSFYNCGVKLLEKEYDKNINKAKNILSDINKNAKGKLNQSTATILGEPLVNGIKKIAWIGLKTLVVSSCPLLGVFL